MLEFKRVIKSEGLDSPLRHSIFIIINNFKDFFVSAKSGLLLIFLSKIFLEACKHPLTGDTVREADSK
jgi:hypothetical protein